MCSLVSETTESRELSLETVENVLFLIAVFVL